MVYNLEAAPSFFQAIVRPGKHRCVFVVVIGRPSACMGGLIRFDPQDEFLKPIGPARTIPSTIASHPFLKSIYMV